MTTTKRNSSDGGTGGGSFQIPLNRRDAGIAAANSMEPMGPLWTTPVMIGNQEFSILIDTGSADL